MKLSQEDIKFLKELQYKLKTQDNDYQAAPRFWGVAETKRIYGVDGDFDSDGFQVVVDSETYFDDDENGLKGFSEHLIDTYEEDYNEKYAEEYGALEEVMQDFEDICDLHDWCENWLEEFGYDCYKVHYRDLENVISQETGCFLTKEACKKHIESNHYHYKKPRTYAMTAWRNPEFERLMRIIENIEFEEE